MSQVDSAIRILSTVFSTDLLKEINSDVANDNQDIDNIPSTNETTSLTEENKRLFFFVDLN